LSALGEQRVRDSRGRLVIRVSAAALAKQPWLRWNALCALLSSSSVEELHPSQQAAWRVFEYESEVQNGGHGLFFDVRGGVGLDEAVAALAELGAASHAAVLATAVERWRASLAHPGATLQYQDLDRAFAVSTPSVTDVLEAWLATHPDDFVAVSS